MNIVTGSSMKPYDLGAREIVDHVLDELSGRKGLDVEEIIGDDEIYQDLIDTMVERVKAVLRKYNV